MAMKPHGGPQLASIRCPSRSSSGNALVPGFSWPEAIWSNIEKSSANLHTTLRRFAQVPPSKSASLNGEDPRLSTVEARQSTDETV
jgi:hypothetical protein